ncbi:MAG: extracellular solute-binding protein [Candidatus Niyogibacteria bacterium]|nr:extracellular solute-binding protein [Candidatus Niyogibacteria bacterium]
MTTSNGVNFTNIIIFVIIGVLVIAALGIFTGAIPINPRSDESEIIGQISIWLPENQTHLKKIISEDFKQANEKINVSLKEIPDEIYEQEILEALAANNAPDIWLLSHELVFQHQNKISPIPFSQITQRTYLDTFIDAADIYLKSGDEKNAGYIIGLPVSVDPLVLYWNKDLFSGAGISQPPKTWDEFLDSSQKLVRTDASGNFTQSGAALGEFKNIQHAKSIISLLILQTGNPIVEKKERKAVLNEKFNAPLNPAASAFRFFNEFSDSQKASYSWNFSLAEAQNAFISQKLGMYFGFASEYEKIIRQNPHLNFDVIEVPQINGGGIKATYGQMNALVLSKQAAGSLAAWQLMTYLISYDVQKKIQDQTGRPSVRRDVLAQPGSQIQSAAFIGSAVKSRLWLDPDAKKTSEIFKNTAESMKTGKMNSEEAVQKAKNQLQMLLE